MSDKKTDEKQVEVDVYPSPTPPPPILEPLRRKKYIVCGREDREEWGETHTDKEWKEIEEDNSSYDFTFEDVKSAVNGFFEELFEEIQENGQPKMSDYLRLKRKWFEDVIE